MMSVAKGTTAEQEMDTPTPADMRKEIGIRIEDQAAYLVIRPGFNSAARVGDPDVFAMPVDKGNCNEIIAAAEQWTQSHRNANYNRVSFIAAPVDSYSYDISGNRPAASYAREILNEGQVQSYLPQAQPAG